MKEKVQINERELATLCSRGDGAARRKLYELFSPGMLALCRRYLPDTADAQDLVQDAFIRIFDKIGKFRYMGEGSLSAWVTRLTVNMAVDRLRKKKKMIEVDIADVPEPVAEDVEKIPVRVITELITSLPEQRRLVFNLFCIEKWPHARIADALGITENASSITLHKARIELAAKINEWLKRNA